MMEIEKHFTYHAPKGDQIERYERLREKAKELAHMIQLACPESIEKNKSLYGLKESVMWANAAIAINE